MRVMILLLEKVRYCIIQECGMILLPSEKGPACDICKNGIRYSEHWY